LVEIEDEKGFIIKPVNFYTYCEGYIAASDLQKILKEAGWDVYQAVRRDNLSMICDETDQIKKDEIENLVKSIQPYLKNV